VKGGVENKHGKANVLIQVIRREGRRGQGKTRLARTKSTWVAPLCFIKQSSVHGASW
jgi:Mg-chelatase subunit ChlI